MFNSYHPANAFHLTGNLPRDRNRLLEESDEVLASHTRESCRKRFDRSWFKQLQQPRQIVQ